VYGITSRTQVTIAAAFQQLRFVSAAQHVAGEFVRMVEENGVGALEPGGPARQAGIWGFDKQK
jgi:hypothetical protein